MNVTIIFRSVNLNNETDTPQVFTGVSNVIYHNSYNFVELQFTDGSTQRYNLGGILSIQTANVTAAKKPVIAAKPAPKPVKK